MSTHGQLSPSQRTRVREYRSESERSREDRLAVEEPLEVRVGLPGEPSQRVWLTMRTPGNDFELAAGFCVHEGLLTPDDVRRVAYCTDVDLSPEQAYNVVTVTVDRMPEGIGQRHVAKSAGSSACGVCGKESIEDALALPHVRPWDGDLPSADVIRRLPEALREHQRVFSRTGGVHAAALATADGDLLVVREDVGRHNAVDKVTGSRVLAGERPDGAALVVSGRAGFELVQKAVAVGTGCLVAVGAPTSLSVRLAEDSGLALYGFTAKDRTVRYA